MDLAQVMTELESRADEGCRRIFKNHGAPDPLFGVKVGELKIILKAAKKAHKKTGAHHDLALQLWETGNTDARYLAGLMADEKRITEAELDAWAHSANWFMLSEYAVGWLAAESAHGLSCARRWIDDPAEMVADAGWATWGSLVALRPDEALDLDELSNLLDRVEGTIHSERNRVRYAMNGFVIGVGAYVAPLRDKAQQVAARIGKVQVDLGGTACKVPLATEYIQKVVDSGRTAKRAHVRC